MFPYKVQIVIVVAFFWFLIGVPIQGQTQSERVEQTTEKNTEKVEPVTGEQSTSTTKNKESRKKAPPKTVFKPTEEISEDAPVPFPVDI